MGKERKGSRKGNEKAFYLGWGNFGKGREGASAQEEWPTRHKRA